MIPPPWHLLHVHMHVHTRLAPALAVAWIDPPGWLHAAVLVLSVLLATLTIVLMVVLSRRPAPDADPATTSRPARVDPVLLVSALAVIALAIVVWRT